MPHSNGGQSPNPAPEKTGAEALTDFIERIEAKEADKRAAMDDIKELYSLAKAKGFDPSTMRQLVKFRANETVATAKDHTFATYLHAVRTTEAARPTAPAPESPPLETLAQPQTESP